MLNWSCPSKQSTDKGFHDLALIPNLEGVAIMIAKVAVAAISLLVTIATLCGSADAVPITVTVDGVQRTGTDSVVLASGTTWVTFGNLKIRARNGSGDAKVVAGGGVAGGKDSTEDELQFINAEIKRANTTVPDNTIYHIVFEGTFDTPPNTTNGSFSYELTGAGTFNSATTAGNSVTATPNIESPAGTWTTWTALSHTVSGGSYLFFVNNPTTTWRNFPSPAVTASRKLKVDVGIKLQKTTDYIQLGSATGIMLQDAPAHGDGPRPDFPHPWGEYDKVLLLQEQVSRLHECLLTSKVLPDLPKCLETPPSFPTCVKCENSEKLSKTPLTKQPARNPQRLEK